MLEKLTTHDIKDVVELFRLTDKCVRAVEGQAWHAPPALEAGKDGQPNTGAAVQGGGSKNNNKKKAGCNNQPLVGAPTTVAAAAAGWGRGPRDDKRPRQTSDSDDGGAQCPVHISVCHNARECREIKKLTAQYREQLKQQQQREDGAPSLQQEGKQKVDPGVDKDDDLGFQQAKRDLKAVYDHSGSESSDNEHLRCSTSCSGALGTSPPNASSKPYVGRWRQPRLPQRWCCTASGWRCQKL
jgi:hypothetical protein